jgi:maltose phosphorylase
MGKIGNRYLDVEPYGVSETGFHAERNEASESIFSLGNEYSGVRGFLEEGISLPSLVGTYYNGIIEYSLQETPNAYKGIAKRSHFTINSPNYLKCRICAEGEQLDLAKVKFSSFKRSLDFRSGLLVRSFVWLLPSGKKIKINFERLLGMKTPQNAVQRINFCADSKVNVSLVLALDGGILHWGEHCYWNLGSYIEESDYFGLFMKTISTHQSIVTLMKVLSPFAPQARKKGEKDISEEYRFDLLPNEEVSFTRLVDNLIDKHSDDHGLALIEEASGQLDELVRKGFDGLLKENEEFFKERIEESDIEIDGDEEDQQGIRFCLFNLQQAYHGLASDNNIGAKGLTGEAYSGHAFWDSETYCLPYYLFTSQKAAKDLLLFRFNTLEQAKKRAKELDCEGACFPIATRNGEEACTLWQHASTQIQPTTAVAYALFHYMNLYEDYDFMNRYGLTMLLEIDKFLLSRGQWNQTHEHFGYYGVMGPDEFEVMVNHNMYTNIMAKKTFEYTLSVLSSPYIDKEEALKETGFDEGKIEMMKEAMDKMLILYDGKTHLFEQHQGFYDLPHIDVDEIPVTDFPLYSHWSYDRIYRNDMIKQPDVLMFLFLYNQDFSYEEKKANYEYYEPRCIHESSLSPSVHSILAEELGKEDEALSFFGFATRLDLDDYNRNTREGLHMTSIAAAWMNIVYGYLGLRSDKEELSVNPKLPKKWSHYSVKLNYRNAHLRFDVYPASLKVSNSGERVKVKIYGKSTLLEGEKEFKR